MAIYTRSDFAKECGVSEAYIGVYIGRGKVVLTSDGQVDSKQRDNFDFLRKQLDKKKDKQVKETVISAHISTNTAKNNVLEQEEVDGYDLSMRKKAIDIEKVEVDVRLAKLKEEKLRGELIPVEIVKGLFLQHSQSILTEFKNSVENFITVIAKRKELNINEVAEIRGEIVQAINTAVDKAVDASKKNVNNIIKEFSNSKGIGEHE